MNRAVGDNVNILRVVPQTAKTGQVTGTNGTQVLTADGQPVSGVMKIELIAECNGVWMARLHTHVALGGDIVARVMPPDPEPEALARLEAKLDALILLLTEEPEETPQFDLDGNELTGERDESQSL